MRFENSHNLPHISMPRTTFRYNKKENPYPPGILPCRRRPREKENYLTLCYCELEIDKSRREKPDSLWQ